MIKIKTIVPVPTPHPHVILICGIILKLRVLIVVHRKVDPWPMAYVKPLQMKSWSCVINTNTNWHIIIIIKSSICHKSSQETWKWWLDAAELKSSILQESLSCTCATVCNTISCWGLTTRMANWAAYNIFYRLKINLRTWKTQSADW